MDEIQEIAIELLDDHPNNPRLFFREDVINGIAAQIQEKGHFDPSHALLVRPLDERFQIIRGHQRKQGAIRAGLSHIPCWVREMTDEEAYWELGLGNAQGELKPIEIGRHALGIEDGKGGRGQKGGLSEYARMMGKNRGDITTYRNAAEVFVATKNLLNIQRVLDKAAHLAHIHSTPRELWPMLTEWLFTLDRQGKERSVNQAKELTKDIGKLLSPISGWKCFFLPFDDLAQRFIENGKPTIQDVKQLVHLAYQTRADIKAHQNKLDPERFTYTIESYFDWLRAGTGTYSWDIEKLREYYRQMQEAAEKASEIPESNPKAGEWYRLGKHLLYCGDTGDRRFWEKLPSVPFAFADPPYNAGVDDWDEDFEWNHDWLTEKAKVVAVTPGIASIQDFFQCRTQMPYVWSVAGWAKNGMTRGALGFGNWIFTAIFCKDKANLPRQKQDFIQFVVNTSDTQESKHKGRKPPEFMRKLLGLFLGQGETVIDPFLGSGTTLFEAHALNIRCIGGEIKLDFCKDIIDRWQKETKIKAEVLIGNPL